VIEGQIQETFSSEGKYYAKAENVSQISKRIALNYYSKALDRLDMYGDFRENLIIPKRIFLENHLRQDKVIYGNMPFLRNKTGLYANIIYLDFRAFYPSIYKQIANHIDEKYVGKPIKNIVKRKQYISQIDKEHKFSKKAKNKALLVDIKDIAKNSVKIDLNDKSTVIELIKKIEDSEYTDIADKSVAKITRNALAFGFGYQQKIARVNNISAVVMFIANRLMDYSVRRFEEISKDSVIFSHTDSFMTQHFYTKELEDAIKYATEMLNSEYFGGVPILNFDISNITIKNKFEELLIINQNSYIYSKRESRGKLDIGLALSGITTTKKGWGGISRNNEHLDEILNDNINSLFHYDKEFFNKYQDTEFIYSHLKDRLSEEYKKKITEDFINNKFQDRYITIGNTIKHIDRLLQPISTKV